MLPSVLREAIGDVTDRRPADCRRRGRHKLRHGLVEPIADDAGAILLVGCMADAGNHDQPIVPGYRYHDANHTNGPSGNASPQAIYNATHGTWLWPPAENDKPNG
jgi:hypothetical protein